MKKLKVIVRDNLSLIVQAVNEYNEINPNNPIQRDNIVSLIEKQN